MSTEQTTTPDVAGLLDELEIRDAEHGTPGRATLTTDDVRRALLGDATPDPTPATYPPDMRPSQILGMAIDAHRHTRIGGGDPGDPASFIARWLVEQDYVLRSTIPGSSATAVSAPTHQPIAYQIAEARDLLLKALEKDETRRLATRVALTVISLAAGMGDE